MKAARMLAGALRGTQFACHFETAEMFHVACLEKVRTRAEEEHLSFAIDISSATLFQYMYLINRSTLIFVGILFAILQALSGTYVAPLAQSQLSSFATQETPRF